MSARQRKDNGGKWIMGRGAFLGTSILAVLIGGVLIGLGWSTGHGGNVAARPPVVTTASGNTTSPVVVVSGTSIGSPSAPVTVVEYSDFQCPHCQEFADTVESQINTAYVATGKIRFVYKYIVAFGEGSLLSAEAAQAAAEQNQFWPYHDALMQAHFSSGSDNATVEKLEAIAQQLGLNMTAFDEALTSGKYEQTVMQDDAEGRSLGITGVPSFFFNGAKQEDSVAGSFDNFKKALDKVLAGAGG